MQTLIMAQKINLRAENEDRRIPDAACQDHMIGKRLCSRGDMLAERRLKTHLRWLK